MEASQARRLFACMPSSCGRSMLGQLHSVALLRRPKAPGGQQGAEVNARVAERIVPTKRRVNRAERVPVVDAQLQRREGKHVLRGLKLKIGVPKRLEILHDRLASEGLLPEREFHKRVRLAVLVGRLEPLAAQQVHVQLASYLLWLLSADHW
eukprot:scaffold13471_cov66-Phaeocystis_antarctica.AAC.1